MADAKSLLARAPSRADAIEFRLDGSVERIPVAALLALDPRPVIVTWRGAREGGHFDGSLEEYRRLILEAYGAGAIVDVEHASGVAGDPGLTDGKRVVESAHFPFGLPVDWEPRLAAMKATGPVVVKLVAGAAHLAASLAIARIAASRSDGSTAIFPMGPASLPGRILAAHISESAVSYSTTSTLSS
jgi:3-dehydroquinate dehydratase